MTQLDRKQGLNAKKIDKKIEFILPNANIAKNIMNKAFLQVKAHSEVLQPLAKTPDNKEDENK